MDQGIFAKPMHSLTLDTPWGLGEENYGRIIRALSSKNVELIVEFGSGTSTVRLCKDFPRAKITSVEHQRQFRRQTVGLLREHKLSNVVVRDCPIARRYFGIRSYLTYDLTAEKLKDGIDFVLIDGPVESETLRGREAPLYMVFPHVKLGGLIALHDYHRASAKAVVKNWLNSYKENLRVIEEYERIILLKKCGHQGKPSYPGIYSIIDNFYANIRLAIRTLKRFIGSIIKVKG